MPTKKELYQQATVLNIKLRSKMNKAQLEFAIRKCLEHQASYQPLHSDP